MRFTQSFVAALSAAAAQAVIITNADFSSITVGTPFVITYSEAVGPVTVYLGTGDPSNVIQGAAVGSSSGTTGSISWTPSSGGSYALKIVDAGAPNSVTNPNFSGFFNVAGPVVSTTGSVTSAITTPLSTSSMTSVTTPVITSTGNGTTTTTVISTSTMTRNGTTSSSSTGTSSSSSSTSVPTQVPNSMAAGIASPLAFVMVAVGALLTLN